MSCYDYIGIIGHDHCGSTVVSRLLGEVDGIECGGELHWLIDAPARGELPMRAGWKVSRQCAVHGESCSIFTRDFIERDFPNSDLYEAVKSRAGARTLVSSDKYPENFEKYVAPGSMLGVVMFKHPYSAVTSDVLTNRRSFQESIDLWSSDYGQILRWASGFCREVIWKQYEDFACNPIDLLEQVCRATGNTSPGTIGQLAHDYHFIGGNAPARSGVIIRVDDRWKRFLDKEMLAAIDNHPAAQKVLRGLTERKS